jgi:hypothetical protein
MKQALSTTKPKSDREYVAMTRKCLCCGRGFESEWEGNRVCWPCKQTDAHQGPAMDADDSGGGVVASQSIGG